MSNLTSQILIKVTPELNEKIDKAFSQSVQRLGKSGTRSDYIRTMIDMQCSAELDRIDNNNKYVKNDILNQVLWTMLTKLSVDPSFLSLYVNDFNVAYQDEVEEAFRLIVKQKGAELNKTQNGKVLLESFNKEVLRYIALGNLQSILQPGKMKDLYDDIELYDKTETPINNDIIYNGFVCDFDHIGERYSMYTRILFGLPKQDSVIYASYPKIYVRK